MSNFPLFETLCFEKGQLQNLCLHQQRMNKSLIEYYGSNSSLIDLEKISKTHNEFLNLDPNKVFRCRIDYNNQDYQLQIHHYNRKHYKTFQTVICDDIDYHLKYSNRDQLNTLLAKKGNCDEIIIIKNGYVTDCSIGNLIFKKENQWFTPNTPLLHGTQRTKLLAENKIIETTIQVNDIATFDEIRLINALNSL